MSDQPTSVYRYYDADAVLIYVGITNRGMQRQHEHNIRAEWWPYVTRQEVEHYPNRPEAAKRERELIQRHRPPFNMQHNLDPDAAKAAYYSERERRGTVCPCGSDCQLAANEHLRGWGIGWEAGLKASPRLYADAIAELVARDIDDPEMGIAARRFLMAGMALATQLETRGAATDAGEATFLREALPTLTDINSHRAQLAAQDETGHPGDAA